MAKILFETKDPLGNVITLFEKAWKYHCKRSEDKAFELARFSPEHVKKTVEDPLEVRKNMKSSRVNHVYLREWAGIDAWHRYLKVAVWLNKPDEKEGFVTTVIPTVVLPPIDKKSGEVKIWPK